jgi:hypothetical protein
MVPGLVIGSVGGAYLASILKTTILMIIFAVFLAYVGIKFLLSGNKQDVSREISKPLLVFFGTIIGVLAALMGLGGGVFIVPLLKRYIANMREVVAISAVCLIPISFIASIAYMIFGWGEAALPKYSIGYVYWPAVIPLVLMAIIFTPMGVKLVHRMPQKTIKRIFGVFICLVSASMFYSAITGQ